jgi:hypothetical protein
MAVYTPFIRVALAAYTATQRGERLSVSKLPPWMVETDVHVVVRPQSTTYAPQFFPEDPTLTRTPITQIVLTPRGRAPWTDGIPPKWLTTDLSYLAAIGGAPFEDAVAAAAFDPAVMMQNVDVEGFWKKDNDYIPTQGFLDANEKRNWR